jgi:predicted PurR-regulated permease PerM
MSLDAILKANKIDQSVINQELSSLTGNAVDITVTVFENIIALVSLIVVSLYMILDRQKVEHFATSFFAAHQEKAQTILRRVENKLGAWLRGQIVLSLLIGASVYIGLTLLGIPYALPLAIITGILEIVPMIGPIISAIPAVIIAFTISPVDALIVIGLYIVIQQLEGHLVVPQVMKRAVGLNPLLVILAISIGGRLLGIGGALLAVPIAVVFQIIAEEVLKNSENPF